MLIAVHQHKNGKNMSITSTDFLPVNTFVTTVMSEAQETIRVTKDPRVTAVDEATFARLVPQQDENAW